MRSLAYEPRVALNAICPYFTMFPLEYPLRVLKAHRDKGPTVVDPFCGRGTTLFAARSLGLECWGVDSSPVAVAIARAKLSNSTADEALALAHLLIRSIRPTRVPRGSFFRSAFHPKTLRDLCSLREGLGGNIQDTDASVLLRAAVLGCLHGPLTKSADRSYFSNQMPRTFAPKPAYAERYWRKRRMRPPEIDVLQVLRKKLELISHTTPLPHTRFANVVHGDACTRNAFRSVPKFSLVVTSPPYYGMETYVQDQWLRNWFLGGPAFVDYSRGVQLEHGGQEVFAKSLGRVWANVAAKGSDDLHMYIRFGVIPSSKVDAPELMRQALAHSGVKWRVVSCRNARSATSGKRQAEQMQASSGACDEYDFHVVRA